MTKLVSRVTLGLSALSVVAPVLASAADFTSTTGLFSFACTIIGILFYALILAAIFFVILAAFKYLTAGGDPDAVKGATKELMYAVVAVVVGILAKSLPSLAANLIGGSIGGAGC